MSTIVGQNGLKQWAVKAMTLPRCIILSGPRGSGKTLLSKYIAEVQGMDFYEVPENKVGNVREVIEDSQALNNKRLYHFEGADKMTNAAQNALLKIAEEPPNNAYILLAVENENNLLPTIQSRGRVLFMHPYTKQDILSLGFEEEVAMIAENIGQAQQLSEKDCTYLYETSKKVATVIGKASMVNVFNIPRYLEEEDYELFISFLLYQFDQEMRTNFSAWHLGAIRHIYKTKDLIQRTNVNKLKLIEMMCLDIWREHRNEL